MDLKKLNKEELTKLKKDIELELEIIKNIKSERKKSKEKNTLSDLNKNDKIFCFNFYDSEIYNMDYVEINFQKKDSDIYNNYTKFSTNHDTKPMGCSSSIINECMNNHYFLSDFVSSMYFYTLKPESWKIDLKSELDRLVKSKEIKFNAEVEITKNKITNLINNNEVDILINKYIQ